MIILLIVIVVGGVKMWKSLPIRISAEFFLDTSLEKLWKDS